MKIFLLSLVTAFCLAACDKDKEADLVSSLKIKAATLDSGSEFAHDATELGCTLGPVAYDVKKTDSIVTPYQGFITSTLSNENFHCSYKVILDYEEGKWVVKDVQGTETLPSEVISDKFKDLIKTALK